MILWCYETALGASEEWEGNGCIYIYKYTPSATTVPEICIPGALMIATLTASALTALASSGRSSRWSFCCSIELAY